MFGAVCPSSVATKRVEIALFSGRLIQRPTGYVNMRSEDRVYKIAFV